MKYPALITKDGSSYLVEFPGLDGCLTEGSNLIEAVENAKEALDGWLESNYTRNIKVKEPHECLKLAKKQKQKGDELVTIPTSSVIALAYLMRFSRKKDGNKSLEEYADLMNFSQQNYSKVFENPKANPTLDTIEKGLNELGYVLEINVIPKSESIESEKVGRALKSKAKIQNFDLSEKTK